MRKEKKQFLKAQEKKASLKIQVNLRRIEKHSGKSTKKTKRSLQNTLDMKKEIPVHTIEAEMRTTVWVRKNEESMNRETKESIISTIKNQRAGSTTIGVEAVTIDRSLITTRIAMSTVEENIIVIRKKITMKRVGIMAAVGTDMQQPIFMWGVREIKMMNKAHPVLHFLLLYSLCLILVSTREIAELKLT